MLKHLSKYVALYKTWDLETLNQRLDFRTLLQEVCREALGKYNPTNETGSDNVLSIGSLEDGKMIDDLIIEVYLQYLLSRKENDHTIKILSSFFYEKFIKLFMNTDHTDIKRIHLDCVKWEKNIKLFDYHFITIPICLEHHWFLVIFCNQPDIEKCLLIFDSLNTTSVESKITVPIRLFLYYRWQIEKPEEKLYNFLDHKFLPQYNARVPKQTNNYDCGIHLLHTFEKFLVQPLDIVNMVTNNRDLKKQWRDLESNNKRAEIRRVIKPDHRMIQ